LDPEDSDTNGRWGTLTRSLADNSRRSASRYQVARLYTPRLSRLSVFPSVSTAMLTVYSGVLWG
jgi:hypothetical protein